MIGTIVTLPVTIVRTVAALPGRLEAMERSMAEMQRLLTVAVEELAVIKAHTNGMHGQLGRIDLNTSDLSDLTTGLESNTARLLKIASPLERGVARGLFRRRTNGAEATTE